MNAHAKNIKPPEAETPEALLNTFEAADQNHKVFCQYGIATTSFYNVPIGFAIDGKALNGWLAMPMHDSSGTIIGIAYLSDDRNIKPIFDPQLKGCVVFGKPEKDKPLFVVSSPEAAFAISLTSNACLLTFTLHDWGGKNSLEPKDAGNMAYVIKAWSAAGYARITASFLDREIKIIQKGSDDSKQGSEITFTCDNVEPFSGAVDACELFDLIECSIVKHHAIAEPVYQHYVTLWGVSTWFIEAFRAVPYLHITAPLKNSGKSNLLDVVASFSYRPLAASDITGSALFRVIEMHKPTLFIDEVDELLGKADSNGLTGLLNDGYKSTGRVIRCVGDDHTPRQFNVFGFKALCGIGQLSKSTTASRCVKVSVRPMVQGEQVNDILHISPELIEEVNAKLKRLQIDRFDDVKGYDGNHVEHLLNRDKQIWSAVYAVAALGGVKWIDRLKCAERVINDSRIEVLDDKVQLLADIKRVFESMRLDAIHTSELLERLCADTDALWFTWQAGKPMDAKQLASLLSDFGIGSKNVTMGRLQKKGYKLSDFKDAFNRYLKQAHPNTPNSAVHPSSANDSKAFIPKSAVHKDTNWTAEKPLEPLQTKEVDGWTAEIPLSEDIAQNVHSGTDNQGSLFL